MSSDNNFLPTRHTLQSEPARVLQRDPYLASSMLQKAIRRGAPEMAQLAARALHQVRGKSVWRRLMVIAFEDIGIGSVDTLIEIVRLATQSHQSEADTQALFLHAVELLTACPKDRSSDYLICTAVSRRGLEGVREMCDRSDTPARHQILHDESMPLTFRAAAAWYLSGLNASGETRLFGGDRQALLRTLLDLGVPETLVEATGIAATKTREPIVLMVPLLWLEANRSPAASTTDTANLPPSTCLNGLPLYALDKHTRLGKTAINRLVRENEAIKTTLQDIAAPYRWAGIAGMAAYYLDAVPVSPRLVWHGSLRLELMGIETDMEKVGVLSEDIPALMSLFRDNHDHLDRLRADGLSVAFRRLGL